MISLFIFLCCVFGSTVGKKTSACDLNYHECGKLGDPNIDLEVGVFTTEPRKIPWHVAIYRYDELIKSYDRICGGTIISPNVVLTATNCVYDSRNNATIEPTFLKALAGYSFFEWSIAHPNVQDVNVNDILISNSYLRDTRSYEDNIAILMLAEDLEFNDFVRPVCLPSILKAESTKNRIFQTSGWILKGTEKYSKALKRVYYDYKNIEKCQKKYSSKICVLTSKGRKDYDTGGGLVQKKGDRYYLVAILGTNIDNEFSPSTNITRHLDWLSQTLSVNSHKRTNHIEGKYADEYAKVRSSKLTRIIRDVTDKRSHCQLPSKPGLLSYTIHPSSCSDANNCNRKGGEFIPSLSKVKINCAVGYGPSSSDSFACINGTWFVGEPECVKYCPALKIDNLKMECTHDRKPVSCSTYMKPGTLAKFRCAENYLASNDLSPYSDSIRCLPRGRWSDSLPRCSLECGRINQVNQVEATLSYGNKTTYGEYPWHIALYLLSQNRYDYICGGSLISENFVLTAAHCMFNPASYARFKEDELKVAAGKGTRDYYTRELYQVNSDVINIIVPDTYVGDGTRFAEDIALLHTKVYFMFNHFVLPVCIDRLNLVRFPNNLKGTIVGWGLTENDVLSEKLQEVQLPTMPIVLCREIFQNFSQFLTSDKYCVIHQNGSGTQKGDSGGGMTFEVSGQHYIYGIVSIKPRDSNLFSVFTNVTTYQDWVDDSMKNSFPNFLSRKCGILSTVNQTLTTSNSEATKHGGYPWAVLILGYHKTSKGNFVKVCAGTLIYESFVLTVAHCMMELLDILGKNITTFKNQRNNNIFVSAGVNNEADKTHEQILPVVNIIIPEGYAGKLHAQEHHDHDITLVQVNDAFKLNDFVLPACLERSTPSFIPQPGDKGAYLGWPMDGERVWKSTRVSVPNIYECLNYKIYGDKFCCYFTDGFPIDISNMFEAGLTFLYKGRYYLRGVYTVNLYVEHNRERFAIFTNVSAYYDWINKEIENRLVFN